MTTRRTDVGREEEAAVGEVFAHVRGATPLPCRIVDDPAAERIVALRRRMKPATPRQRPAGQPRLPPRPARWSNGRSQ